MRRSQLSLLFPFLLTCSWIGTSVSGLAQTGRDPVAAPSIRHAAQDPAPAAPEAGILAGGPDSFSIANAAHGIAPDNGELLGGGGDYKVVFDNGGIVFTPALGSAVAVNQNLRLTLESIRRGGAIIYEPATAVRPERSRIDQDIAQYRHGDILEQYEVRADMLKQSFVFGEPLAGSGDLVVRMRVETNMTAEPGERLPGLQLRAGELSAVDIGAVLGIDGDGREGEGYLNYTGSHLELVLPDAFVANAQYPLVLDPPIGTSSVLGSSGLRIHSNPDVAYEPNSDLYLVVWEMMFSATDDDIRAHRVDSGGQLFGSLVIIDQRLLRETDPTVCAVAAVGKFVVAYERNEHSGPFTQDIIGRTVDAATGSIGAYTPLVAEFTDDLKPSLGGDSSGVDDECILVFESFSQRIEWREITVGSSGTLVEVTSRRRNVGPIPVPATLGVDHTPAISKDCGVAGRFLVAWIGTDPETAVYFRFFDRNSNVLSGVGGLLGTRMRNPAVSGDGLRFALAYERASSGAAQDVWGLELAVPASTAAAPLGFNLVALESGPNDDDTAPALGLDGDRCLLAISDARAAPDGPTARGTTLRVDTMTRCGGWYQYGDVATYAHNLQNATAPRVPRVSGASEALIVFTHFLLTPQGVQAPDIRGVRWTNDEVCPGDPSSYGVGCAPAGQPVPQLRGNPATSPGSLVLSATQGPANGIAFFTITLTGAASVPIPQFGPGCDLLVNSPYSVFWSFFDGAGAKNYALPLPAGFPGIDVWSQVVGLSQSSQFSMSNAITQRTL